MIIASIDLMKGKAVQLRQGKEKILEVDDVLGLARSFDRFGEIALIDLDQALGLGDNRELIRSILGIAPCRVGGGIRSPENAEEMISWGAGKIILGSMAFHGDRVNHEFLAAVEKAAGREKIIIAVDSLGGEIVTKGWKHTTGLDVFATVRELEPYCSEFLFTCVDREGTLTGIDLDRVLRLRESTCRKITAAGGIRSLDEIRSLAESEIDAQLGMALYTEKIGLADGFVECLNWKKGLIPTIAQDEQGRVLMLAYSSRESLQHTFSSGEMHYYSRSRKALWKKGETSGNIQTLIRLRADCDRDTILATVHQEGNACHENRYSCFGCVRFSLDDLFQLIRGRLQQPSPQSYTANLTLEETECKLREEIEELITAVSPDEIIWEAADIIYFLWVYLAKRGVCLDQVRSELQRRRRK